MDLNFEGDLAAGTFGGDRPDIVFEMTAADWTDHVADIYIFSAVLALLRLIHSFLHTRNTTSPLDF
jgi:hypothetical protein